MWYDKCKPRDRTEFTQNTPYTVPQTIFLPQFKFDGNFALL